MARARCLLVIRTVAGLRKPMPSDPKGLAIARARIAAEHENRTGFLDLGKLGLTELPEELFALENLWGLNLGAGWPAEHDRWQRTDSALPENRVVAQLARLTQFPLLRFLSVVEVEFGDLSPLAGLTELRSLDCSSTQVSDLRPLAGLTGLQSLHCSRSQVSDLRPLAGLTALQSLDCSRSQVSDLRPLAGLTGLQSLGCDSTKVSDLSPLAQLAGLQSLSCANTQVSDLRPLAGLTGLQSLFCYFTQVSDLSPLAGLTELQSLVFLLTRVSDLSPLAGLTGLESLYCGSTQVSDLSPLAGLTRLQSLSCASTLVSDLSPLAGLTGLNSLDCDSTQVSDLSPLAGLTRLRSLSCHGTQVNDLGPLARLAGLQSISCGKTQVSDLGPLAGLAGLQQLHCGSTQVSDLSPLAGLTELRSLACDSSQVSDSSPLYASPKGLLWHQSFGSLHLFNTQISNIPAEVLSRQFGDNCLERVRAHLRDSQAGDDALPDVKVLVLGNGRIGKTQICRRLRGEKFEENAESTHGIRVTAAEFSLAPSGAIKGRKNRKKGRRAPIATDDAKLHLWDFGGQDLYHGTHALFMRTRSIFIVVWTPQSEDTRQYEYGGITFSNHPLSYWVEFIRHLSGADSPVLIVQNMCERPEHEVLRPPVHDAALQGFAFRKLIQYSARDDRGRGALDDGLKQAIEWLRQGKEQARIGKGRLEVRRKLEALRDGDQELPAEQRRFRTVTQDYFLKLCNQAGNVSSPELLLDYLHHAGVVFYQRGLFDDSIILDQGWALDAIYAVFQRQKCYRQLHQLRGRFTRTLLEALVWQNYSADEQKLFLSLMTSCGVCFVHRQGDREGKLETEYIAPELLPSRDEVTAEIDATWGEPQAAGEIVVDLPFLHPGVMRGIISRIGNAAGMSAVYWKDGACFYETSTRSRALIEQRSSSRPDAWSGQIVVSTQGGQSAELLGSLEKWIIEELQRSGCRDWQIQAPFGSRHPALEPKVRARASALADAATARPEKSLAFAPPPSDKRTYCVSYAWNDASKAIVDDLCDGAKARGIEVLRDVTGMGLGESIVAFMRRLGASDRVIVVLCEKYLKSAYCMFELLEVWRNCSGEGEVFRGRISAYALPDARMSTPLERAHCAKYWKEQFGELDALVRANGADLLGTEDFKRYKLMQDFAHRVGDMLALIADTLTPRDIEELKRHAFDDASPAPNTRQP
jgi:internalin A